MQCNHTTPWYMEAVFYELYVRAFRDSNGDGHGDLVGVIEKLDYLKELGIDCIWLLPVYDSPLEDDGYDISDHFAIHEDYGTVADFERLVEEAHARGLRIIADFVVNHTSDRHPWFIESRSSRVNPKRDWYVWSPTDDRYSEARIIFVDTESSNWTYDEATGEYYWHRFYTSQPDLNFDNVDVQSAMLDVMKFWLDKGIDGFRVDAVPYLYEREGTNCENLPEGHAYLKRMRRFVKDINPDALLLCEANQPPRDVVEYFGDGDEFHMGFHFPLMPRIFMALRSSDVAPLRRVIEQTPPIPEDCQWCTFLRNHDELTLEMVTDAERDWMWAEYAPEPGMRLNRGIRRRLAPLLDNDPDKILLANSLLFSLPGAPIIYYGDEIGMGDDLSLPDRNGVRTPMQWNSLPGAGFSKAGASDFYSPIIDDPAYGYQQVNVEAQRSEPLSLLSQMKDLIALRKSYKALSCGALSFLDTSLQSVLAFTREYDDEIFIIVHNLHDGNQIISLDLSGYPDRQIEDVISRERLSRDGSRCSIALTRYGTRWLRLV